MSAIIFIAVLAVLVLVHEFGHYIAAKKSGMKVPEFGIGFPPRIKAWKRGDTEYSLNAIPFGGFVKIYGEDFGDDVSGPDKDQSFGAKSALARAVTLVAGVTMNVILAWLLFSLTYLAGAPATVDYDGPGVVKEAQPMITVVAPGSPAERAGLKPGDIVNAVTSEGIYSLNDITASDISNFIEAHGKEGITFDIQRKKETLSITVLGERGVLPEAPDKLAVGVGVDKVGIIRLPPHLALIEGARDTWRSGTAILTSTVGLIAGAFQGKGDFSQIAGPVGIARLTGEAFGLGFVFLIEFAAIISINLAVVNLLPFPALDGGRLLFLGIETITGKKIPSQVSSIVNGVGFILLIGLMLVVTWHDIARIIG